MKKKSNLDELIEKYNGQVPLELVEDLNEYQKQMNLFIEESTKNEVKYLETINQVKTNLKTLNHEIRRPLANMASFSRLILQDPNLPEEYKEYMGYIDTNSTQALQMTNFTILDFASEKERIEIEKIMKEINSCNELYMKDNKIGLTMRYSPVSTIENRTMVHTIMKTLNENALMHVPEYSRIEQGIRKDKTNQLEILIENIMGENRRDGFGEGKGIGQKTAREFIKNMNGEFHTYNGKSQIVHNSKYNHYDEVKKYGNPRATDHINENDEVYGVKIRLPIKE